MVGTVGVCHSRKYAQMPFFHQGIKKLCRLSLVSLMDLKQVLAEGSQAYQEWNRKYSSQVQEPGNCLSHHQNQVTKAALVVIWNLSLFSLPHIHGVHECIGYLSANLKLQAHKYCEVTLGPCIGGGTCCITWYLQSSWIQSLDCLGYSSRYLLIFFPFNPFFFSSLICIFDRWLLSLKELTA